jgi:hypothetical protein
MDKFTQILQKTLEIINYSGEHLEFIEKFINQVYMNAILFMIKDMPEEKQGELNQAFDGLEDPIEIQNKLSEIFNMEEFNLQVNKEFELLYYSYIEKLAPILSEEKSDELASYLKTQSSD